MEDEIKTILKREGPIAAIKRVRELTGSDLRAAKQYVDGLLAVLPPSEVSSVQRPRQRESGCAILGALITAVVMVWGVYSCNSASINKAPDTAILGQNSGLDGSVYWVEQYLKRNLKDPDSYQGIEWSVVETLPDRRMRVRHKYRAKNSFGGYVVEQKVFVYDSSGVVHSATDY
jgi:hypothetical protein